MVKNPEEIARDKAKEHAADALAQGATEIINQQFDSIKDKAGGACAMKISLIERILK